MVVVVAGAVVGAVGDLGAVGAVGAAPGFVAENVGAFDWPGVNVAVTGGTALEETTPGGFVVDGVDATES